MISAEENELLTGVGPDTPMGELLRHYWHPIGGASELTGKKYTKMVRLLGEDLVLYKDRSGTYGLIEPLCAHRRINLLYGVPLAHGLRCPYHGWAYDETGACIEQPYEEEVDPGARFKDKIKLTAYPVQELGGLLWAYLGPQPAPLLPRWEPLIRPDSLRDIGVSVIPCNWLQIMENSLDPVHVEWLHQDFANYVQEQLDRPQDRAVMAHKRIGFDPFKHGIIKRRTWGNEDETSPDWQRGHPILFPNTLVVGPQDALNFQFRVPVDDTNTLHIFYTVYTPGVSPLHQDAVPVFDIPLPLPDANGQPPWELMDNAPGQDIFAWVTQGAIADRTRERLGHSDEGIILYRKMLRDNLRQMQLGQEPMNVFRNAAEASCIEIITERDKTERFGGPAAKYSPITPHVQALFAQARGGQT
jgi:5,5'-dehydrodivanillate O-demethylase